MTCMNLCNTYDLTTCIFRSVNKVIDHHRGFLFFSILLKFQKNETVQPVTTQNILYLITHSEPYT